MRSEINVEGLVLAAGRGIGASRAAGAASLSTHPAEALAVLLGDMPWLRPDTCTRLIAEASFDSIVQPYHERRSGHPVLFGRRYWPAMRELDGDEGAGPLVHQFGARHPLVEVEDSGILLALARLAYIDTSMALAVPVTDLSARS